MDRGQWWREIWSERRMLDPKINSCKSTQRGKIPLINWKIVSALLDWIWLIVSRVTIRMRLDWWEKGEGMAIRWRWSGACCYQLKRDIYIVRWDGIMTECKGL